MSGNERLRICSLFIGAIMAKRVFIWVGHPRETSLSHGLADAYEQAAKAEGAETRRMNLHDMTFDADLTEGYHARKTLEPCLEDWRKNTVWADHLVWIYPQWWGGMPAKMKGVVDRCFLPGFAMAYHDNGPWWDRLLEGRSADIFMTSDAPVIFDSLSYGRAAKKQVEKTVLNFSGVKPRRTFQFGPVKTAKPAKIEAWKRKAAVRGKAIARRPAKA
ncbi:flavodoxin family protein [Henriciella barbarensis]|uniref:Flavodoxin family protein n=1 Tax=Henriciella barbarensis TaxID=86342 RepID=A0A399R0P8_9PROT|nr:NAD(P)H-dependent oxidoreductase [Henriciella barbarensis]RIJ23865.1 flavodoxin family protein [Henriciella barbarensis]